MTEIRWNKQPMCEACGDEVAYSFSCSYEPHIWRFTGDCTVEDEMYYITLERFFASPAATIDWLSHLDEKNWFDATGFMKMINRFRAATNSYGAILK